MALKFRRGTTAQKSGSLAFGEPYVNSDLGTLQIGGPTGDITLSSTGTGSTGNFGAISGSGLDITGNANIAGNVTVGGKLTIGDATSDTVNVVASLSSSLIPETTNAFDLGSAQKIWRDLYISTGSIKFVAGTTVVKELTLATITGLESATGSSNAAVSSINSFTGSQLTQNSDLAIVTGSLISSASTAKTTNDTQDTSISNLNSFTASINTTIKSKLDADGVVSGSSQVTISSTNGYTAFSSSLDSRISTEKGRVDAILSASTADADTFAEIVTLINSVDTTNDQSFAAFYTASNGRLNNLETTSASVNTSVSNLNSFSSSALTRLSALEIETTNLELTTASLNTSVTNLNSFSSSQLTQNATLATYTGSVEGRFTTLASLTGSNLVRLTNLETTSASVNTSITNINVATASLQTTSASLNTSVSNINTLTSSALVRFSNLETTSGSLNTSVANINTFTASMSTTSNVRFGSLGIGMAASGTSGRIDAAGDIVAFSTSDRNFKENITVIPNAIEKIRKISGNTYDWKADMKDIHGFEGNDVGVIAQEIEEVLPQLVTTRETGYKAVKYDKLVALLIEGIKEQQQHIDNLTIQVEELKKAKGL